VQEGRAESRRTPSPRPNLAELARYYFPPPRYFTTLGALVINPYPYIHTYP